MIELKGRRVIVTGGGRGIGAACAVLFARAGADVIVGYRTRRADAESVVLECISHGTRATAIAADLSQRGGADALCIAATAEFGAVDIMVANAGFWPTAPEPIATMSDARWHDTAAQNYESMFQCARAAARSVTDGGRIVFVSSTAGQRGEAFHADYASAKGAMISLTKSMAVELAPRQVTVNAVAPGWIETAMVRPVFEDEVYKASVIKSIPMNRMAATDDVALSICFLLSDWSRHITGEIININGGTVLCG